MYQRRSKYMINVLELRLGLKIVKVVVTMREGSQASPDRLAPLILLIAMAIISA